MAPEKANAVTRANARPSISTRPSNQRKRLPHEPPHPPFRRVRGTRQLSARGSAPSCQRGFGSRHPLPVERSEASQILQSPIGEFSPAATQGETSSSSRDSGHRSRARSEPSGRRGSDSLIWPRCDGLAQHRTDHGQQSAASAGQQSRQESIQALAPHPRTVHKPGIGHQRHLFAKDQVGVKLRRVIADAMTAAGCKEGDSHPGVGNRTLCP